jgi:non-ribosomal peptide synthetase component F
LAVKATRKPNSSNSTTPIPAPVEFHNVYGPTECTCICSSYQLRDEDFQDLQGLPPLGELAPNFSYLIIGDDNQPAAPGEIGELCLLGPQVGRGYYNDAPREPRPPSYKVPSTRIMPRLMYKTGDLVRLDPASGQLLIQGRKDNQIKHMGYRIELEEIEAALCTASTPYLKPQHCIPPNWDSVASPPWSPPSLMLSMTNCGRAYGTSCPTT